MAISEEIRLFVLAETAKSQAELKKLRSQMGLLDKTSAKSAKTMASFGSIMSKGAMIAGGLYTAYRALIKPASDLEEQHSKFTVVFRENIEEAERWADTLVDAYAMSRREAYQYLASVQDLLKPMGIQPQLAAEMSNQVVKLAADLGSFNNLPTKDVIRDITAAFAGSSETVRKYGADVSETRIKQIAMNQGLWDGKGMIDRSVRAQLILREVMRGNNDAIGDMGRTSESFANTMKKMTARAEDFGASIGKELLPGLIKMAQAFLVTSRSGGSLSQTFQGIARAMSKFLEGLSNVIMAFNKLDARFQRQQVTREFKSIAKAQEEWVQKAQKDFGRFKMNGETIVQTVQKLSKEQGWNAGKAREMMLEWNNMGKVIKEGNEVMQSSIQAEVEISKNAAASMEQEQKRIDELVAARQAETDAFINSTIVKGEADSSAKNKAVEKQREADRKILESMMTRDQSELEQLDAKMEGIRERKLLQDEEMLLMEEEYQERRKELIFEKNLEIANQSIQAVQNMTNAIGAILNQDSKNKNLNLDKDYNKQKARIMKNITDEDERKKALEKLDQKFDKKRRALQREQARRQKAMALMGAIVNTAQGITAALANPGGIAGIVLAAIVGALGAVQIGMIAAQPLPAAEGALIKGSSEGTLMQLGEKNRNEMVVPFENEEVQDRIGGFGGESEAQRVVNIENFYAMGDAQEMATMLDREFFKLDQDQNSTFADSIREGS